MPTEEVGPGGAQGCKWRIALSADFPHGLAKCSGLGSARAERNGAMAERIGAMADLGAHGAGAEAVDPADVTLHRALDNALVALRAPLSGRWFGIRSGGPTRSSADASVPRFAGFSLIT